MQKSATIYRRKSPPRRAQAIAGGSTHGARANRVREPASLMCVVHATVPMHACTLRSITSTNEALKEQQSIMRRTMAALDTISGARQTESYLCISVRAVCLLFLSRFDHINLSSIFRHFTDFQHGHLGHSPEEDEGCHHHGCSHRNLDVLYFMVDYIVNCFSNLSLNAT